MGYRQNYGEYEREYFWTLPRALFAIFAIGLGMIVLGSILGWFSNTAKVAQEQFGAEALLRKYEWFKDASAGLDKKRADITVYEQRLKNLEVAYKGVPRKEWPRDDREQFSIWQSEEAGIKASYNSLAADYNSQMSKFNYRFTNVGELPGGATIPLPREYKEYISE